MTINSNKKGKNGEREFCQKLSDLLGVEVKRNLSQTRDGGVGGDTSFMGCAIEIKRERIPRVDAWWRQTLKQAAASNREPVLAYRLDRRPWRIVIRFELLSRHVGVNDFTAEISLEAFALLLRNGISMEL